MKKVILSNTKIHLLFVVGAMLTMMSMLFTSCYKVSLRDTQFQVKMATVPAEGTAYSSPPYSFAGDTVRISAIAKDNFHFKEWRVITQGFTLDNATINANPALFIMPAKALLIQGVFEINAPDTYTLTLNYNDGSTPNATQSVAYNQPIGTLPMPTRTGYSFVGWYKEVGLINAWNLFSDKVMGNTTLYAKWLQTVFDGALNPDVVTICSLALPYTWHGKQYTGEGTYSHQLPGGAANGYDSIAYLKLQFITNYTHVAVCESYTWPVNGTTYTVGGVYREYFTTTAACDSVEVLELMILQPIHGAAPEKITVSNAELPTFVWNGNPYPAVGNYTHVFPGRASNGCDSIAHLELRTY